MNKHDYKHYPCNERFAGETHLDYFKCCNCGDIVYRDTANGDLKSSQHSPYYYTVERFSCDELIMLAVME